MSDHSRIKNFDFLRGWFVLLALLQHFGYYLNKWYFWYSAKSDGKVFEFSRELYQTPLATDWLGQMIMYLFTPWVSQIYLALAAFNLASRNQEDFKKVFKGKLITFLMLFVFFTVENSIVSQGIGERFSIYPLSIWMISLATLSIIYRYLSVKWIVLIYGLSFFHPLSPLDLWSGEFETWMKVLISEEFEYDAKFHYFFGSACLGFLIGQLHYRTQLLKNNRFFISLMAISLGLWSIWYVFGSTYPIDKFDYLHYEHFFSESLTGVLFNQSVQAIVILSFLKLHLEKIHVPKTFIHWVGINSLLIFGMHRVNFRFIMAPIRELVGAFFNIPMTATSYDIIGFIACSCFISYAFVKSGLAGKLFKMEKAS